MTPLHYIVVWFSMRPDTCATIPEIEARFGDVRTEVQHLFDLGILYRHAHGFDRRYYLKAGKRRSWYSAERKLKAVIARKELRKAA